MTESAASAGVRSLAVSDSSAGYARFFHSPDDTVSVRPWIEWSLRPGDIGTETNLLQCEIIGEAGMGYPAGVLEVRDEILFHWVRGSGPQMIGPCESGAWHGVQWRLDCEADTYAVWLDGERVVTGVAFYTDARYLDTIQFRTRRSEHARVWLDEVRWRERVDAIAATSDTTYTDAPLEHGQTYYYAVSVVDTFGVEGAPSEVIPVATEWTGVVEGDGVLRNGLFSVYPNPFNPTTTIRYSVASEGPVSLRVFDIAGRVVRTLALKSVAPGEHEVVWDGTTDSGGRAASGVYFLRMETADGAQFDRKAVLLK